MSGTITKVSGPLVVAEGLADANVSDVVRVGSQRLIGEILNMTGDRASIQVYEETSGLGPGATVETTGMPMSVELGPGMLDNIYDGIQRPLPEMRALSGDSITRGANVPALNREKKWDFVPVAKPGDKVAAGDVLGTVQETSAILHKIMVPRGVSGEVLSVESGEHVVTDIVAVVRDGKGVEHKLSMMQRWPVRKIRPKPPDEQRPADYRHHVSHRQGRHCRRPRPLRFRQDCGSAPVGQVVRRGHRHLHRLRRARQ